MNKRERLGSRLGFIMLSAGCAIGCGNVWKFPWMCGQNGGGSFMLLYILCLLVLGLPAMIMELAVGRAAQASPIYMYQRLEKPGHKWGVFGVFSLIGNIAIMAFYTVVTGWILYYFVKFLTGDNADFGFAQMLADPKVNVTYLFAVVVAAFVLLSFNLQGGLERVTKYMMTALLVLMLVLAIHSLTFAGAAEGLRFYLVPDFSKIDGSVIVAAMNQAFFSLSVGMGGMAIFGSYIGKERSLMGESLHIIALDTFVAVLAGIIIFPACFTYGLEVTAGPSLLFDTMAGVFNNMAGRPLVGRTVLSVHGVCGAVYRAGRLREHPGHGARADRLDTPERLCGLRRGHLSAGADHGAGVQRTALPALCAGQRVAGLLGFHRQQQRSAAGNAGFSSLLLQPPRLGLGEFCKRGQHRQRAESAALDETCVPAFCALCHCVYLCVRHGHVSLAVSRSKKDLRPDGMQVFFCAGLGAGVTALS